MQLIEGVGRLIGLIVAALAVITETTTSSGQSIPEELREKFGEFLKDPGSAQIEIGVDTVGSVADSSERVICGRYNAKNSYGGYTGFKNFVYRSNNRTLYSDGVVVRPGAIDSLDNIMAKNPETMAELEALKAKGDAIIAEVHRAFNLCAS